MYNKGNKTFTSKFDQLIFFLCLRNKKINTTNDNTLMVFIPTITREYKTIKVKKPKNELKKYVFILLESSMLYKNNPKIKLTAKSKIPAAENKRSCMIL